RAPPRAPLFPYTTLFRSLRCARLLQRLHVVVVGVDEKRNLARGDELRAEDVAAPDLRLHRREPPEEREPFLLAHRLHQRGEPERSEEHTSELQSRGHLVC